MHRQSERFLVEQYKIEAIAIGNAAKQSSLRNPVSATTRSTGFRGQQDWSSFTSPKTAREESGLRNGTWCRIYRQKTNGLLAELVKIDAKSIGVGPMQHDVDQTKLKASLDQTVESCANLVV